MAVSFRASGHSTNQARYLTCAVRRKFPVARKSDIVKRKSLGGIPPDPVALVYVHCAVFFETDLATVVGFIPANGI